LEELSRVRGTHDLLERLLLLALGEVFFVSEKRAVVA
jgi:hypothetical protein